MTRVCASLRSTIDEPRTTPLPTGGKVYRPTNIPREGCVMQHFGISLTCRNLTYDFGRLPKARILQRARLPRHHVHKPATVHMTNDFSGESTDIEAAKRYMVLSSEETATNF